MSRESDELGIIVDQLVEEANQLLSTIIHRTKSSDNRSRLQKPKWTERHRLHVLLEAAQETKKSLPERVVAPWFLAELKATIELIRRWHKKPIWKDIEPSLVNSTHFTHTIAKLHIVERLTKEGHNVKIVPRGEDASPDIMVQAIGGSQDWINIECYQPKILDGGSAVGEREIEKVVKYSMKKAKRQLEEKTPGILAICGFNQSKSTVDNLRQTIANRLQKTERSNFCGILLMMLGIMYERDKENTSFTPIITIDFVPNPSYFGRVDIDASRPEGAPQLIKGPLTDISTDDIISKKIDQLSIANVSSSERIAKKVGESIIEQRLKVIEEPAPKSRVVILSKDVLPLFRGEGNINFLCHNCGVILAERVWKLSISNVIVKCPSCQSYNEFPQLRFPQHPLIGRIGIMKENYDFTGTVILKRGVSLVGL